MRFARKPWGFPPRRVGKAAVKRDGAPSTIEVKSDAERRRTAQRRRLKAALEALRNGGPLPGQDRRTVLVDLDVPFKTDLNVLKDGTERAAADGVFAARLPGDRALLVADIYGTAAQGWTDEEFSKRVDRKLQGALRRAGVGDDMQWHVAAASMDSVSRDPLRVPFAAYPLHPVACARIIGDLAVFHVVTSGPALTDSVRRAGIEARWVLPPGAGELKPYQIVMEMGARFSLGPVPEAAARTLHRTNLTAEQSLTLQMQRSELDMYLIQLLEQDTWLEGIKYLLSDRQLNTRPWPHYRDEDHVWV